MANLSLPGVSKARSCGCVSLRIVGGVKRRVQNIIDHIKIKTIKKKKGKNRYNEKIN